MGSGECVADGATVFGGSSETVGAKLLGLVVGMGIAGRWKLCLCPVYSCGVSWEGELLAD